MKKTVALACGALTLVSVLAIAGCKSRSGTADGGDPGGTVSQVDAGTPPPGTPGAAKNGGPDAPPAAGSADADLNSADDLLNGAEDDLASADATPEDPD